MLTHKRFLIEWSIAKLEVGRLNIIELVDSLEHYKDPTFIKAAIARGEPHFGSITGCLLAINYIALKNEQLRRRIGEEKCIEQLSVKHLL
jgi:hypothetical protein